MLVQFDQVQRRLEKAGARTLGRLVWWSLGTNSVDHADLVQKAQAAGLAQRFLPSPVKPVGAFRRACRRASAGLGSGLLLRKIDDGDDELVYGIVQEEPNPVARELEYRLLAKVTYHKRTHVLDSEGSHPLIDELRELYHQHRLLSTEDVRAMMVRFLGEAGVALRRSGGVYFVAAPRCDELEALCRVVESVGPNETRTLAVFDTPSDRAVLQEAVRRTLEDELRELEEELIAYDPSSVRDSTLERRLSTFDGLRQRAELFQRVLGLKAEDLAHRVSTLQASLSTYLGTPHDARTRMLETASELEPKRLGNTPSFESRAGF